MRLPPTMRQSLMLGVDEQVSPVESVAFGVMIRETSSGSECFPRIIQMEMHQLDQECEMSTGDFPRFLMNHDELPIGKHPVMSSKFSIRVGTFRRVDHPADRRNLGIIFLRHQPE
jgi:hypothetical protein